LQQAEEDVASRWRLYEHMSHQPTNGVGAGSAGGLAAGDRAHSEEVKK